MSIPDWTRFELHGFYTADQPLQSTVATLIGMSKTDTAEAQSEEVKDDMEVKDDAPPKAPLVRSLVARSLARMSALMGRAAERLTAMSSKLEALSARVSTADDDAAEPTLSSVDEPAAKAPAA